VELGDGDGETDRLGEVVVGEGVGVETAGAPPPPPPPLPPPLVPPPAQGVPPLGVTVIVFWLAGPGMSNVVVDSPLQEIP